MPITRVLAQATVRDLDPALAWYGALLGRQPDANPMEGLYEWHLGDGFGVQVWPDAERAGGSTLVLDESDLDSLVSRLDEAGLAHHAPEDATSSRVLRLEDPDGNRVVVTAPFEGRA